MSALGQAGDQEQGPSEGSGCAHRRAEGQPPRLKQGGCRLALQEVGAPSLLSRESPRAMFPKRCPH